METLGPHMGIEGGQKSPKKLPKKHGKGENEKRIIKFADKIFLECQTRYVFWLFGEIIHQIQG